MMSHKQRVLTPGHQGWNDLHSLCRIGMEYYLLDNNNNNDDDDNNNNNDDDNKNNNNNDYNNNDAKNDNNENHRWYSSIRTIHVCKLRQSRDRSRLTKDCS